MTNSRKPIGVCLSQAHTFLKTDFLSELDKVARREGYGIVVFNSSMDYYWEQSGSNISGRVFELLRYDKLSALVILAGDLHDTQMQEKIIHNANISKIPVIWQSSQREMLKNLLWTDYTDLIIFPHSSVGMSA